MAIASIKTSRPVKWLYSFTLIAMILPMGLMGAHGWAALALGGGLLPGGVIIWLPVFAYRIFVVVRNPYALDIHAPNGFLKALRWLGIGLMVVGLLGSISLLFSREIALLIFHHPGDNGIAFFMTTVFLYLISYVGLLGLGVFEISRLIGLKKTDNGAAISAQ